MVNTFANPLNIFGLLHNEIYIKENDPGREFQECHKNFSATFKRKVEGIESH